jgi:hypothetical protein
MPELTAPTRQQKITLGEMRSSGVRGLLIYCSDYHCSHSIAARTNGLIISGSRIWNRGSSARTCGQRGAEVRPDFNWNKKPIAAMGYR